MSDLHLDSIVYYQTWAKLRSDSPLKLDNVNTLKQFETVLCSITKQYTHCDVSNSRNNQLVFSEGSANFGLFKLTPNGDYITHNPMLHLWKKSDVDSNILKTFEGMTNSKYSQPRCVNTPNTPYNLFLLQMASTVDLKPTVDALKYASEQKRFTLFKIHPAPGDGTDFNLLWEMFKKNDLVSDYTVLVDGSLSELISEADIVYSADSACTFNAILAGKPTFNYRTNEFSEIVPLLRTSKDMTIPTINHTDVLRFLTWYYYKLSIDINSPIYQQRIKYIVDAYHSGKSTAEIFT